MINHKISVWYFIKQIKFQLLFVVSFAIGIGLLDSHPTLLKTSLPLAIPAILGTAVSLLLAFRTSQSYERWWEARIIWGIEPYRKRKGIVQLESEYLKF